MQHKPYGPYEKFIKRPQDFLCALLATIVLSPVMIITAILVAVKLGRPVLFKQERPGRNAKIFKIYKFRTMKENSANPRALTIHEVMGRNCGWLTYKTAQCYRKMLGTMKFLPEFMLTRERQDVHAVYLPESRIKFKQEAARLRKIMDKYDCVNVFVSEGAGVEDIIAEMNKRGESVPRDAFGHPRLDKVNVGQYVAKRLGELLGAEKTQVFKSGYFARSAAPNAKDRRLISACARKAVECALAGESGVVGPDENDNSKIQACAFSRVKGGKPFNVRKGSFRAMLAEIGQPRPRKKRTAK